MHGMRPERGERVGRSVTDVGAVRNLFMRVFIQYRGYFRVVAVRRPLYLEVFSLCTLLSSVPIRINVVLTCVCCQTDGAPREKR